MALSPHVPDLHALEVLRTVVRAGSLGAAARELGLSQQAVSSRISTIERLVGVAVLRRGARGSSLTEEGALLVEWAERVLDAAEQLDVAITALRGARDARLDVAASFTVAEYLLPAWLVALRADLGPAVGVNLVVCNSVEVAHRVLERTADLGFVEGPDLPSGLDAVVVATDRLEVVVAPVHRWARRRGGIEVAELAATALVTREAGSGTRDVLDRALAAAAPEVTRPVPALELAATTAIRQAVLAGAGPAALSDLAVRDDIAAGRLVRVRVRGELDLTRQLRGVWPHGPLGAGPGRDLLDLARSHRAGRGGGGSARTG